MKVWVVEHVSLYEPGGLSGVFDSEELARKHIEGKEDFTEWADEDSTKPGKWDYFYVYTNLEINKGIEEQ